MELITTEGLNIRNWERYNDSKKLLVIKIVIDCDVFHAPMWDSEFLIRFRLYSHRGHTDLIIEKNSNINYLPFNIQWKGKVGYITIIKS